MRVELDVFSGRPNPAWNLEDKEGTEFLRLCSLLTTASEESPPDRLGYRGLVVTGSGGEINGFDQVIIFGGIVQYSGSAGQRTVLDPDRRLEEWLLNTGKSHLDDDLFGAIRREIAG